MTIILIILAVCAYDLCGLLALLYFTKSGSLYTRDGLDSVIIIVFWPAICTARIGIAIYRIVRRLTK